MAGWKTSDMLGGIEGIMNLAAASGEDLATTSDIVTDALTAFGLSAADSGHFADILAADSSNANTNVSMITENARTGRRRYQNVEIEYKAFFFNGLPAKTAAVKSWLLSPVGYQKLQDTYDPDFFRMAVCTDALEFDVTAQKAAEMKLTFNCKPQRWSVDGQRAIRLDGRSTLKNPFAFPAQPIFKVYGDSGGELYVGEEKIIIHSIKDYVLLNCETHNAWLIRIQVEKHSKKRKQERESKWLIKSS